MKKILFITHNTNRSGAPLVLLYLLGWIKENRRDIKTSLLVLKKGSLNTEFEKVVDSYYEITSEVRNQSFFKKIIKKLSRRKSLNERLGNKKFDIIYANTVVALPTARQIKSYFPNSKLVAHVHELNFVINACLPNLKEYNLSIDSYIAASNLVKENLIMNYQISRGKITRIYPFSKATPVEEKEYYKTFRVGGCGTAEKRKGIDLFIQLAGYIEKKYPSYPIEFCWIGFVPVEEEALIYEALKEAGCNKNILVGELENPVDYLKEFDVLAMTSREDPFPLVCIEVGMMGKPSICFQGATGTEEIIRKGGGEIVPYQNVERMGEEIIHYYENPEKLLKDGNTAKSLFSEFTPSLQAPKILNLIDSLN